jgi:glycosyltransferase involved in cell wall biosynthesis
VEIPSKLTALFWRTSFYGALTEGGVGTLYRGLVEAFVNLGHKTIFASGGPMNLPSETEFHLIEYLKLLRNFPEVLNFPYNETSLKQMMKIVEKSNPDFFYLHHHDFHYAGAKLKEKTGLPFILHFDSIEYWVKKNWGKLYFGNLLKWCEQIEVAQADAIIVISEVLKQQACEFYSIPPEKVFVSPNGVNVNTFRPDIDSTEIKQKYGLEGKYVIGYSGSFNEYHGIDLLAQAAKSLLTEIPNSRILMVGDGALRDKVEDILSKDGIQDKVIITGLIPLNQVPFHLAACDVLVSPIKHNHNDEFFGSPIKNFEYKAMGKPIVATDLGQLKTLFQEKHNALILEHNSYESIIDRILELYRNPDLAQRIALQARQDAVEKHSWERNVEKVIDLYKMIIDQKIDK